MAEENHRQGEMSDIEIGGMILLAMAILFSLLWYFAHNMVAFVVLRANFYLIKPFEFLGIDSAIACRHAIRALAENIAQVKAGQLYHITRDALVFYLPVMVAPGLFGIFRAWRDPRLKLKQRYTAQTLLNSQAQVFPATTPIIHLDLNNVEVPGWEPSIPPYEFAKKHGLVENRKLDFAKAEAVFKSQIGPRFSIATIRPHEMALAAIFTTRLAKDIDSSQKLLDDLSRSCAGGKQPDFSLATPLFNKNFRPQSRPFRKVHFYTRTLLCSLFEATKGRGVISPSFFLWLKPIDRTLWYTLNRIGSQVPYCEGAGVWNHWKAEQTAFTGDVTIEWSEFIALDELTEEAVWLSKEPEYHLTEIWVRDAVHALEVDLLKTGVITS